MRVADKSSERARGGKDEELFFYVRIPLLFLGPIGVAQESRAEKQLNSFDWKEKLDSSLGTHLQERGRK